MQGKLSAMVFGYIDKCAKDGSLAKMKLVCTVEALPYELLSMLNTLVKWGKKFLLTASKAVDEHQTAEAAPQQEVTPQQP